MTGDPETMEVYELRYKENLRLEGRGFATAVISPCPFCAAADFMTWNIGAGLVPEDDRPTMYEALEEGATCSECGRSARGIVARSKDSIAVEMVQTGGPDPPDYLPPMRRD